MYCTADPHTQPADSPFIPTETMCKTNKPSRLYGKFQWDKIVALTSNMNCTHFIAASMIGHAMCVAHCDRIPPPHRVCIWSATLTFKHFGTAKWVLHWIKLQGMHKMVAIFYCCRNRLLDILVSDWNGGGLSILRIPSSCHPMQNSFCDTDKYKSLSQHDHYLLADQFSHGQNRRDDGARLIWSNCWEVSDWALQISAG